MTTYMSKEVREGLMAARRAGLKKASRLRVLAGERFYPVLSLREAGFSVDAEDAPQLRGLVDLYEGGRHLYQCLIVASELDCGELRYEFKRNTMAADRAPLDHYRDPEAPIALLGKDG